MANNQQPSTEHGGGSQKPQQAHSKAAPIDTQPGQAGESAAADQNEAKRQRQLENIAYWQAGFSVMLVLFTFAQAWFGGCQWLAMDRQYAAMITANKSAKAAADAAKKAAEAASKSNAIASDTAKKQLRAYVQFEYSNAELVLPPAGETTGTVGLAIKNVGQTPARNLVTRFHVVFIKSGIQEKFGPDDLTSAERATILNPGQVLNQFCAFDMRDEDRGRRAYVFAAVDYTDAFGSARHLEILLGEGLPLGTGSHGLHIEYCDGN